MNNVPLDLLFEFGWVLVLLIVGLSAGRIAEIRHLKRLRIAEAEVLAPMLVTDVRSFPMCGREHTSEANAPALVSGESVISSDYFKTFVSMLKKIIGGELRTLETLMSRARREAVLRMARQARALGYDAICNVRIESTDIGGSAATSKRVMTMVCVVASGTAYKRGA